MKRRKPLKRSALARGESVLRRGNLGDSRAGTSTARQPRKRVDHSTWAEVKARSGGACVVCEHAGRSRPGIEPHHVFPKQRNRFPELANEPRGMIWVCRECHGRHELAHQRIALTALPTCVFEVAAEVGDRALVYLQEHYARG